jgi:hypothetical protein
MFSDIFTCYEFVYVCLVTLTFNKVNFSNLEVLHSFCLNFEIYFSLLVLLAFYLPDILLAPAGLDFL